MRNQINDKSAGNCGYVAYFLGKEAEVYANTKLAALDLAVSFFKPAKSKRHMVHVMLAEVDGQPVIHSTAAIG